MSDAYIRKDGTIPFIANESMGGNKLTNLGDGISDSDAANLGQVMSAMANVSLLSLPVTMGANTLSQKFVFIETDGKAYVANNQTVAHAFRVVGVTETSVTSCTKTRIVNQGLSIGWTGLTPGQPYWLGTAGGITLTKPTTGFAQLVGIAAPNGMELIVQLLPPEIL